MTKSNGWVKSATVTVAPEWVLERRLPDGSTSRVVWAKRRDLLLEGTRFARGRRVFEVKGAEFRVRGAGGDWLDHKEALAMFATVRQELVTYQPWGDENRTRNGGYAPRYLDLLERPQSVVLPIPKIGKSDDPRVFERACKEIIDNPHVRSGWVDGGKLHLVVGGTQGEWHDFFGASGVRLVPGRKVEKRLKAVLRPGLVRYECPTPELRMKVLDDKDYPGLAEAHGDGACVLRRSTYLKFLGPLRDDRRYAKLVKCRTLNGNFVVPEVLGGGLLKGNFFVLADSVMDELHGEGTDVVTHKCNLKKEVRGSKNWTVLLEPQFAESSANTSLMSMINNRTLYPEGEVRKWITSKCLSVRHAMETNEMLETLDQWYESYQHLAEENGLLDSDMLWDRRSSLHFLTECGLRWQHSPHLVRNVYNSHTKKLLSLKEGPGTGEKFRISVPIPCSATQQVVSQHFAELLVGPLEIEPGHVKHLIEFGCHVVRDDEWLDFVRDHGGCDMDDHFILHQRMIGGERCVVILRHPNDVGEYSLKYHTERDPVWESKVFSERESELGYEVVTFPELPDFFDGLPTQAHEEGFELTRLPEDDSPEEVEWSREALKRSLARALGGSNPGGYVNVKLLLNSLTGKQQGKVLDALEKVIDEATQGVNVAAMSAIQAWCDDAMRALHASGAEVDRAYWEQKELGYMVPKDAKGPGVKVVDTWITRLVVFLREERARVGEQLLRWAHESPLVPEALQGLGWPREAGWACRKYRRLLAELEGGGSDSERLELAQKLFDEVTRLAGDDECSKQDAVMSLAAWAHRGGGESMTRRKGVTYAGRFFKSGVKSDSVLFTRPFVKYYLAGLAAFNNQELAEGCEG